MNLVGVGSVLLGALLMLNVIPLASLQIDTTPPNIYAMYPTDGATYQRVDTLRVSAWDDSGLMGGMVSMSWSGQVALQATDPFGGEWGYDLGSAQVLTATGTYTATFTVTDNAGNSKTASTTFKIASGTLSGKWKMNDVTVTSSNQKVVLNKPQVTFTFTKDVTATSVEDRAVAVSVTCVSSLTASCSQLSSTSIPMSLDPLTHTWTGSASFPDGTYSLILKADAGSAGVIALNIVGNFGVSSLPPISMNMLAGAILMVFGVVLIVKRKETI